MAQLTKRWTNNSTVVSSNPTFGSNFDEIFSNERTLPNN